ncbi:unnamed protein product [Victoria cruziana]
MVREEVPVSTQTLQWKCVESRADNKHLYYELEGTCITREKFDKVPHEYSTIVGIEESVHEILMNLKKIVFRSDLYGTLDASIYVRGPRQHIAVLTEPVDLCIELKIERGRGYCTRTPNNYQDRSYPIDVVSVPIRNENHSIHSYGNGNEKQDILFLEIWTNETSHNLIDLFIPFLHAEEHDINRNMEDNLKRASVKIILKHNFIDQLELPSRTYNCLKRSNIHTLLDLLSKSE